MESSSKLNKLAKAMLDASTLREARTQRGGFGPSRPENTNESLLFKTK